MDKNKILQADILDIIFEGRNKDYGAYELRKTYNRRVVVAVSIMVAICLSASLSSILANSTDKNPKAIFVQDLQLEDIEKKSPLPEPPPPPPPPPPTQRRVQITRFTPPEIVRDELVTEPPPPQDQLDNTKIGTFNVEGTKDESFVAPPVEVKSTGIVAPPAKLQVDYDQKFIPVEKEARFPGGPDAWHKYLEKNLNANAAQDDGAPVGSYTVKVQFVVNKEGAISNVTAIETPKACPSCAKEAVKIIQRGPHWEPAIQNGQKVTYQAIQYITFQVAEE